MAPERSFEDVKYKLQKSLKARGLWGTFKAGWGVLEACISKSKLRGLWLVSLAFKRTLKHESNTYWDQPVVFGSPGDVRDSFLRDPIQGVDHPSRKYLRNWLQAHPGLSLLDIPCGPGVEYEGFQLHKVAVRYIGMDMSDWMLKAAQQKFPEADFRKGNILSIPMPNRAVDVVLCRHILEHLEDYRPAIREALRVARNHVFVVLFRLPTHSEKMQIGWNAWDNRLDWGEMEAFLRSLGVRYTATRLSYDHPVGPSVEENTVVEIGVDRGASH